MEKQSPNQIGEQIREFFPYFTQKEKFNGGFQPKNPGAEVASFEGASKRFHDFCQIGALLTDEQRCMIHLAELSKRMASHLVKSLSAGRSEGFGSRVAEFNRPQQRMTPEQAKDAKGRLPPRPKFFNALRQALESAEQAWGFNTPTRPGEDAVVLTGFVHPVSFEELLLKQARHWKDPGTTLDHGEYTHRLQWWIVCREHETRGPYSLLGLPVDRFKQLPKYKTNAWRREILKSNRVDPDSVPEESFKDLTSRGMWDFLFDAVPENDALLRHLTTPASSTFRSPQYMNMYLTSNEALLRYPETALLHRYLVNRYNKRAIQRAFDPLFSHKKNLCSKWGITEAEFDLIFEDDQKFGIQDIYETGAEGRVVSRPDLR